MANSIAMNTVNSIFNQRLMGRLKAIATGKGDEKEAEILAEESEIAPISEAALDAGESSSVDSEQAEEPTTAETQSTIEEQPAVEEQPKSETDENEA